ncbi:MAG TPA: hypothetical protein DCM68_06400 [Verrucomicrobia bacterium]|nr:hypothetical protein [Verrucomicrobiota bacterium]
MTVKSMLTLVLVILMAGVQSTTSGEPVLAILQDWATQDPHELRDYLKRTDTQRPLGGYLYRFRLDLTGDGQDELFAASSLVGDGAQWYVFRENESGLYDKLGEVGLSPGPFHVKRDTETGITTLSMFARIDLRSALLVQYACSAKGEITKTMQRISGDQLKPFDDPDISLADAATSCGFDFGETVTPQIEKVLLCKYLEEPTQTWRPYDSRYSSPLQHLDTSDTQDIESIESVAEETVLSALGATLPE